MARKGLLSVPPETATVTDLNHDGEGVLREAKICFVPGALPGESICFQRVRSHRQHDEGQLLEVLSASSDRVEPRCAHFGVCGGCALQHLSPEAQLIIKEKELRENLSRIGKVTPERWLAPLQGPIWQYRRRARLGAKFVHKRGRVLVGFRERQKPYIAALERCVILAPPVDQLIEPLAELIGKLDACSHIPQIEVAVGEGLTVLVFRHLEPLSVDDRETLAAFERAHSLRIYLQSAGPQSIVPLHGERGRLFYRLPGLEMEFEPTDFVQVNATINASMIAHAIDLLEVGPQDRVLDLFCGLGNFTLPLAQRAAEVLGVEGEASLIERARANAVRNGLNNVSFRVANLFDPQAAKLAVKGSFTRALLDPPRAGAQEILPLLAELKLPRLVYVSCHPGTLARDLGLLCHDFGYTLEAAGVIDMFPHTTHVESIAVLERRS